MTNQTITLQPGDTLTVNVPAAAPIPAPITISRTWGVLSGDDNQITPVNCQALAAKGVQVVTVSLFHERLQGTQGADVTQSGEWPAVVARLNAIKAAGMKASIRVAYHYPAPWVLTAVPRFRTTTGQTWSGTHSTGDEVRDWVWSGVGQGVVADFFTRCIKALGGAGLIGMVHSICLGSGPYGEIMYPRPDLTVRWDNPVSISALHPARPTSGVALDNWYLDSQSRYIVWLVGVIRAAGWNGVIYALHPSTGIRPGSPITSSQNIVEFNIGADPARYITAYRGLPNVWPYATWLEDSNPSPSWQFVLDQAKAAGLPCWGENAHSDIGQAGMDLMFDGAVKAGVAGVNWLHRESLLPLLDHYAQRITAA